MLIHGLPHLFLATPNSDGVHPLPGKEASLGEEWSSFGKAGRSGACHDLSPVTPLAPPGLHSQASLDGFMVAIIPPKDQAGDLSPCLDIILMCWG